MKLVFATHNEHKAREIGKLLPPGIEVSDLETIGFYDEIEETGESLEENAALKAETVYGKSGIDCFADDTGLEVEALGGRPGVYSARYAGEHASFEDNVELLLKELERQTNRTARFRTVICLIQNGDKYFFEGRVDGVITREPRGGKGFGYDPVFLPAGCSQTFSEMPLVEKNRISHRGLAFQRMTSFLKAQL